MFQRFFIFLLLLTTTTAAAPVTLEIATQPGVQVTAPQEWLQRLAAAEITQVRIRTAEPGDQPLVENIGQETRPVYRVVGILSARNELVLPRRRFSLGQLAGLKDYLAGVAADGESSVEAAEGRFGLTEAQFRTVFDALSPPLEMETMGKSGEQVVRAIAERLPLELSLDPSTVRVLRAVPPLDCELTTLTQGAALAICLHQAELWFAPEKPRGGEPRLRVFVAGGDADHWPVGYKPEGSPRAAAPVLFEFFNIEIADHTLGQVLDALAPRVKLPLVWDRPAFAKKGITPRDMPVKIPRTKTYYKRVFDRVLAQARGFAEVRVDEAGTPFLWLSTTAVRTKTSPD